MILHLAVSVKHRLVTDRQTHDDDTYRASMALHGEIVVKLCQLSLCWFYYTHF